MSIQDSDNLWNPEQPDGPEKEGLRWLSEEGDLYSVTIGAGEFLLGRLIAGGWQVIYAGRVIVCTVTDHTKRKAKKWAQAEIHRWSMEIARATRPRRG